MENLIQRTPSASYGSLLIKSLIETPMLRSNKNEIVYRGEKRFSYQELYKRICKLANALTSLGVQAGDTVAVMDYDSNRYLELYFAVPMIGAVLHTVNIRLSPEQILYTIDHAEDDVLFLHEDFLPALEGHKGRMGGVKHFCLLRDTDGEMPKTSLGLTGEYESMLAEQPDTYEFPDFDEDTRATTFYTTGTTGMPKGVYFSHRQLVLHTLQTSSTFGAVATNGGFDQSDVYMPITPMFHVHAWGFPYVATYTGVKQVYPGKYVPDILLQLLIDENVTFSHCVPTIMHMLLASPKIKDADLSGWKVVIGGAALPKALCLSAMKLGIDIYAGYGLSETCPILTLAHMTEDMLELDDDAQADVRTYTGRPMGMVDIQIADDEMNFLPWDGESAGEVVVRAPWLTQGYFKDTKHSEQLWRGGYLHTGDVAYMTPDGYLKITDRAKDVIKIGGEWVSSLEMEDIFSQHPAVAEVAVIGAPDDKWGERPFALVVLKDGRVADDKELVKHAKEYIKKGIMARESMLVKVKIVDAIDKTSVGKVDKKLLRTKHL